MPSTAQNNQVRLPFLRCALECASRRIELICEPVLNRFSVPRILNDSINEILPSQSSAITHPGVYKMVNFA